METNPITSRGKCTRRACGRWSHRATGRGNRRGAPVPRSRCAKARFRIRGRPGLFSHPKIAHPCTSAARFPTACSPTIFLMCPILRLDGLHVKMARSLAKSQKAMHFLDARRARARSFLDRCCKSAHSSLGSQSLSRCPLLELEMTRVSRDT